MELIKKQLKKRARKVYEGLNNKTETAFSYANIKNLMIELTDQEQKKVLEEAYFHRMLCPYEESDIATIDAVKVNLNGEKILADKNKPRIFVTFHFGSYRLIHSLLVKHNIKFKTLTITNFIDKEAESYASAFKKASHHFNYSYELEVLDAFDPKVLQKMIGSIRNGYSLVIFQDGNVGSDGSGSDKKNLITVPFLNRQIRIRKGAGYLGYLTKYPITSLFIARERHKITAYFGEDITASTEESREQFCERIFKQIYGDLELFIKKYPNQWDGWFNVHMTMIKNSRKFRTPQTHLNKQIVFNRDDFVPYSDNNRHFLLDKMTYRSVEVTKRLLGTLAECKDNHIAPLFNLDDHVQNS